MEPEVLVFTISAANLAAFFVIVTAAVSFGLFMSILDGFDEAEKHRQKGRKE